MIDVKSRLALALVIFVILIVAGAFIYQRLEYWNWIDSLYFTTMTVTTVGYGDFTPTTNISKIFTIFYSVSGIAIAFYVLFVIGRYFMEHQVKPIRRTVNTLMRHVRLRSKK